MSADALVVLATFPDVECARRIVHVLVEEKHAACGNIIPGIESIYRWQGAVETAAEVLVIFKTDAAHYPALETRLRELHPYEIPECLALRIEGGLSAYLHWLSSSLDAGGRHPSEL